MDVGWREALEMLVSQPTVNIEGLVGGYTGVGGKTILPYRAVAKLDLRLVPDMTAAEALSSLKTHLAKPWFRGRRSEHDWWIRSHQHGGRLGSGAGASGGLPAGRN
jgi:acetylornithine deacetylase/succinyl-diaminopimelate desuccinylase-like protein